MSDVCHHCGGSGLEPTRELVLRLKLPIHTVSEANRRKGPRDKMVRVKSQRETAYTHMLQYGRPELPVTVRVVRVASRKLDAHDNLPMALKAVVDGVADWLGVRDNDERVKWDPDQTIRAGLPFPYVLVEVFREAER